MSTTQVNLRLSPPTAGSYEVWLMTGPAPGGGIDTPGTAVVPRMVAAGSIVAGFATVALQPNSQIVPAGTVYRAVLHASGARVSELLVFGPVPATGGPYEATLLVADLPAALAPPALAAHLADTVDAHDASAVSFAPTGTIAATDVQAAIVEVAAEAGAGSHPNLAAHDTLGLATQAELDTEAASRVAADASHVAAADPHAGYRLESAALVDADIGAAAAIAESKLALASDAAAATPSRRTLGTGATQAAAGTDSRLSDSRTPTSHAASHASAGADAVTVTETQVTGLTAALAAKAPLASPPLTGTPTAPTAPPATNTTQVATTAFVEAAAAGRVADAINDGTTTVAPSQNAVFDALALKAPMAPVEPLRMSKLPVTVDGRAGYNSRVYSRALWTDGNIQYACVVSQAARPTPAVPNFNNGATASAAAAAQLVLTKGAGINEEGVFVACIAVNGATTTSTVTPPAGDGWTLKGFAVNSGNVGVWVFEKVYTTFLGSTGPWTFTRSDLGNTAEGSIIGWHNAAPSGFAWDPIAAATGNGTAVAVPVVTTAADNSLVFSAIAAVGSVTATPDAVVVYTERTDSGTGPSLSTATIGQVTAGPTPAATHTLSATAQYACLQFSVAPMAQDSRPFVTRRTLPDGAWETATDLSLVASNALAASVDLDEHNVMAVARGPDGRVYVVGNMHSEPSASALRMIRTVATDGSLGGTWEAVTIANMNASLTYPEMIRVANGDLLLFGRNTNTGSSLGTLRFARLTAAGTWDAAVTLIDGVTTKNPYWSPISQDPADHNKIAMFVAWRTAGTADNGPLQYFESLDGGVTWRRSGDATALTVPVRHSTDTLYVASPAAGFNNAETVDAAVDILNQSGATVSTTGVPQIVYQKANGAAVDRQFHAYRTGTVWTIRELPAWSIATGRASLFAGPTGRVYAIANTPGSGQTDEVQVVEVTPSVTLFDPVVLASWTLENNELPLDTRAALVRGELHILLGGSQKMFDAEYMDDINWRTQSGWVLTVPGARMWEVQRDLVRPVGVEVVGSSRFDFPVRVEQTALAALGPRIEVDRRWIDSSLMVRARARGLLSSPNTVGLVAVNEHVDPSTDGFRSRMIFTATTEEGHETPWVPLAALGGDNEGYVQLWGAVQPTTPAATTGVDVDLGFMRLSAITVELGRVRV